MLTKIKELTAVFTAGLLQETEELINWDQVKASAFLLTKEEKPFDWLPAAEKFKTLIEQAAENIASVAQLKVAKKPTVLVLTRQEWVVLTCHTIKPLVEKVTPLLTEPFKLQPSRLLKTGLATELGLALGFLSNHVLGQYDLPLAATDKDGNLFFLLTNIKETQKLLQIEMEPLFYWLTSHEYVHYLEFNAFNWLKPYFLELVNQNVAFLEREIKELSLNEGQANLLSLYQRRYLENSWPLKQTQAFMALIEGYSDFLTYHAAAFLGTQRDEVANKLNQARQRRRPWHIKLIEQLLGLEIKKQQYTLGYSFLNHLYQSGGLNLVNQVWASPAHLPTLSELNKPSLWLKRVATGVRPYPRS